MLARWSGWGAVPKVFDPEADEFADERAELQAMLDDDEYAAARRNILNAHYTDAGLVQPVWQALQRLGLDRGQVLEPGCGVGNFLGFGPDGVEFTGIELDPTTARMAALTYPDHRILAGSFADVHGGDEAFDAAIGNVPFARARLHDPGYNDGHYPMHTHFLLKSLRMTRPGGLVGVWISRWMLDGQDTAARAELAEMADLVTAVRTPLGAHAEAAGTDVVTDFVLLRRRNPQEQADTSTRWQHTRLLSDPVTGTVLDGEADQVAVNEYFLDHPDHVLGSLDTRLGRFGPELTVHAHTGVALTTSLQRVLGADVDRALQRGWALDTSENTARGAEITLGRDLHQRFEGTLAVGEDGSFTRWQAGRWQPHEAPKTQARELRELIGLRETVQALLEAENAAADDTENIVELRGDLNQRYDAYVARYGPINRFSWRAQSKPGWSAFAAWCREREHATLPADGPVVLTYLQHLVDAGCDQTLVQRHFEAITKRHTAREQPLGDDIVTRARGIIDGCRLEPAAGLDLEALGLTSYTRKTPPQGGFRTDPFSSLVRALEVFDPTSQQADKADIFHRRVVQPVTTPTRADSAVDAVSISLTTHAELRLDVVAGLLGLDGPEQAEEALTSGETPLAFLDPDTRAVVVRNDYLSGDVRAKLAAAEDAASADPTFNGHVEALRAVVPTDLGPDEIEVQLGSWIQADYVQQFLRELLGDTTQVAHHDRFWSVQGGNQTSTDARDTWGTSHRSAQQLVEATLTGRQIRVTFQDSDGTVHTNAEATEAAKNKARELSERFRDWVWEEPTRAEDIVTVYNERFNAHVPRSYDDIELTTPGLASHTQLRSHQKAAIAAMIFQPSFGLWHEVGAGKTLEMIAGAMERKRLGLVEKQVINVPNHMLEQFEREWLQAYPQAKLLVASSEELSGTRRRDFVARAMTGNFDAVILTEGAFKALPVSPEAEERFIAAEADAITDALEQARASGAHERTIKELEERQLEAQEAAKGKLAGLRRDPGVSWEDLGFDSVIVDESQRFKNSRRFSGLPDMGHPGADRSVDLDMKLGLLAEQFGHARYTSATATPFTNSLAEIYTELRRLGADVEDLDTWARTWGELMSTQEMTPGGGFKEMTRLRKLINVPELAMWLRLHADIRTAEHLQLPVPEITGGAPQAIAVPPSTDLVAFNAELARRYKEIKPRPEKGDDNHLSLIGLGTQAALDMRLVDRAPDEPQKVDLLADRIAQRYQDNKDNTYLAADGETPHPTPGALQVVFCSVSTPDPNRWNFYDELRTQLTSRGVPEHLVRFIHEAPSDQKRAEMFAAARSGDVAVLIGSSEKMGTGTNVQKRAIGLYQVSPPWRADTVHQEAGRVVRQGNQNSEVFVERWTTEQSLEAKKWQVVLQKWEAFRPLMTGEIDRRIIEMPDEDTDHYAELMAMASGDDRVRRKAALESEVNRLTRLHKAWARQQTSYQVTVSGAEDKIPKLASQVDQLDEAIAARTDTAGEQFAMTLQGTRHTERVKAAAHLTQLLQDAVAEASQQDTHHVTLGRLGGIEVRGQVHRWLKQTVSLRLSSGIPGEIKLHHRDAASSHHGLITKLENWIGGLGTQRDKLAEQITTLRNQAEQARPLIGRPFAQQAELDEASAALDALNAELSATAQSTDTATGTVTSPEGLIDAYQARLQDETVPEEFHDRLRQVLAHADPRASSDAVDQPDPQRLLIDATSGLAAVATSDGQPWTVFTAGTALTIPLNRLTSGTDIGQDISPHTREQAQAFLDAALGLRDADGNPPPLHSPEFTPGTVRDWRDYEGRSLPEAMRAVLLPAYLDALGHTEFAEQVRARFPTEQPPPQPAAAPAAPEPEPEVAAPSPPVPASPVAAPAQDSQQPAGDATTAPSPVGEITGVAIGADGTARRFDVPTGPAQAPADPDSESSEQAESMPAPVATDTTPQATTARPADPSPSQTQPSGEQNGTLEDDLAGLVQHHELNLSPDDHTALAQHLQALLADDELAQAARVNTEDQYGIVVPRHLDDRFVTAYDERPFGESDEVTKAYFNNHAFRDSLINLFQRHSHAWFNTPRTADDTATISGESTPGNAERSPSTPPPPDTASSGDHTSTTGEDTSLDAVAPGARDGDMPALSELTRQILHAQRQAVVLDDRLPRDGVHGVLTRIQHSELDQRIHLAARVARRLLTTDVASSPAQGGVMLGQQVASSEVTPSDVEYRLQAIEAIAGVLDAEELGDEPTARGRPGGHAPGETIATSLRTAVASARAVLADTEDASTAAADAATVPTVHPTTATNTSPLHRTDATEAEQTSLVISHDEDGTVVRGTQRGDSTLRDALRQHGFRWSRRQQLWYLPSTWTHATRSERVHGLVGDLRDQQRLFRLNDGTSDPDVSSGLDFQSVPVSRTALAERPAPSTPGFLDAAARGPVVSYDRITTRDDAASTNLAEDELAGGGAADATPATVGADEAGQEGLFELAGQTARSGTNLPSVPQLVSTLTQVLPAAAPPSGILQTPAPAHEPLGVLARIRAAPVDGRFHLAARAAHELLVADTGTSPESRGVQLHADFPDTAREFEHRIRVLEAVANVLDAEGVGQAETVRARGRDAAGETLSASVRAMATAARTGTVAQKGFSAPDFTGVGHARSSLGVPASTSVDSRYVTQTVSPTELLSYRRLEFSQDEHRQPASGADQAPRQDHSAETGKQTAQELLDAAHNDLGQRSPQARDAMERITAGFTAGLTDFASHTPESDSAAHEEQAPASSDAANVDGQFALIPEPVSAPTRPQRWPLFTPTPGVQQAPADMRAHSADLLALHDDELSDRWDALGELAGQRGFIVQRTGNGVRFPEPGVLDVLHGLDTRQAVGELEMMLAWQQAGTETPEVSQVPRALRTGDLPALTLPVDAAADGLPSLEDPTATIEWVVDRLDYTWQPGNPRSIRDELSLHNVVKRGLNRTGWEVYLHRDPSFVLDEEAGELTVPTWDTPGYDMDGLIVELAETFVQRIAARRTDLATNITPHQDQSTERDHLDESVRAAPVAEQRDADEPVAEVTGAANADAPAQMAITVPDGDAAVPAATQTVPGEIDLTLLDEHTAEFPDVARVWAGIRPAPRSGAVNLGVTLHEHTPGPDEDVVFSYGLHWLDGQDNRRPSGRYVPLRGFATAEAALQAASEHLQQWDTVGGFGDSELDARIDAQIDAAAAELAPDAAGPSWPPEYTTREADQWAEFYRDVAIEVEDQPNWRLGGFPAWTIPPAELPLLLESMATAVQTGSDLRWPPHVRAGGVGITFAPAERPDIAVWVTARARKSTQHFAVPTADSGDEIRQVIEHALADPIRRSAHARRSAAAGSDAVLDAVQGEAAATPVDVALALRSLGGDNLVNLVRHRDDLAAFTPRAHAVDGQRLNTEPDAGAQWEVRATTTQLQLQLETPSEVRRGQWSWQQVGRWLAPWVDPTQREILLAAADLQQQYRAAAPSINGTTQSPYVEALFELYEIETAAAHAITRAARSAEHTPEQRTDGTRAAASDAEPGLFAAPARGDHERAALARLATLQASLTDLQQMPAQAPAGNISASDVQDSASDTEAQQSPTATDSAEQDTTTPTMDSAAQVGQLNRAEPADTDQSRSTSAHDAQEVAMADAPADATNTGDTEPHVPEPASRVWPTPDTGVAELDRLAAVNTAAAAYFTDQLDRSPAARDYLAGADRLGSPVAVELVRGRILVGYGPQDWTGLIEHLRQAQFSDADMLDAGVATRASRSNDLITAFYDRIVVGIRDEAGRLAGFTGRDLSGQAQAKYRNTAATELYRKSELLFGMSEQHEQLITAERVVLCEGPFDAAAIMATAETAGRSDLVAIAACGTAITTAHLQLLDTAMDPQATLVIAADNDENQAGRRKGLATVEQALVTTTRPIAYAEPPETGHDPASWAAQQGSASLQLYTSDAQPGMMALVSALTDGRKSGEASVEQVIYAAEDCVELLAQFELTGPRGHELAAPIAEAARTLHDPTRMMEILEHRHSGMTTAEAMRVEPGSDTLDEFDALADLEEVDPIAEQPASSAATEQADMDPSQHEQQATDPPPGADDTAADPGSEDEQLAMVSPLALRHYLTSTGWVDTGTTVADRARVFTAVVDGAPVNVLMPTNPQQPTYPRLVAELVGDLESRTGRARDNILAAVTDDGGQPTSETAVDTPQPDSAAEPATAAASAPVVEQGADISAARGTTETVQPPSQGEQVVPSQPASDTRQMVLHYSREHGLLLYGTDYGDQIGNHLQLARTNGHSVGSWKWDKTYSAPDGTPGAWHGQHDPEQPLATDVTVQTMQHTALALAGTGLPIVLDVADTEATDDAVYQLGIHPAQDAIADDPDTHAPASRPWSDSHHQQWETSHRYGYLSDARDALVEIADIDQQWVMRARARLDGHTLDVRISVDAQERAVDIAERLQTSPGMLPRFARDTVTTGAATAHVDGQPLPTVNTWQALDQALSQPAAHTANTSRPPQPAPAAPRTSALSAPSRPPAAAAAPTTPRQPAPQSR